MERIGVFQEMGYISIGAPYVPPSNSMIIMQFLFVYNKYIDASNSFFIKNLVQFNTDATKGKQMYGPGTKVRAATKDGYFAKFDRVFEAEGYTDPVHMRRVQKMKDAEKNVGKAWVPVNALKKPYALNFYLYSLDFLLSNLYTHSTFYIRSGVGSNFGTFSGPVQAFSPQRASAPPYKSPGKNVLCNPPKKGTGYG